MRILKLAFPFLFILSFCPREIHAQEEVPIGLFVYNFTRLFDWPESAKTGNFVIQVVGHQSVYNELTKLTQGKKVGAQNIIVQHTMDVEQLNTAAHIIFVGHWQSRHLPAILGKVGTKPCLVVTEAEGLLDQGSGLNFIIRENKLVFEVKPATIAKANIKTDRRVLELAYRVAD